MDYDVNSRTKVIQNLPIPLLDLSDKLVRGELSTHNQNQVLDNILSAVHVEKPAYYHWQTGWIHLGNKIKNGKYYRMIGLLKYLLLRCEYKTHLQYKIDKCHKHEFRVTVALRSRK